LDRSALFLSCRPTVDASIPGFFRCGLVTTCLAAMLMAGCASAPGSMETTGSAGIRSATSPRGDAMAVVNPRADDKTATATAAGRPSASLDNAELAQIIEKSALEQEGYVAPTSEPSVVVAPPTMGPVAPDGRDLWGRIRAGFALPPLNTSLVAKKEQFYLDRPEYMQRMFARGSRYLYYIVEEVEKRGMPTELALLPFVESAMNPSALSSAQAAGLWQFIPSTGRTYNLSQNWWVDDRRDVVHSTQAALDYLQKIYAMHGNDWFLALASYNWGEGAVGRAVKKNQARGKSADYLSLDMPAETRNYVPKLIAIKNILMRAQELGVALPELPNRPYFVTIEKTRPIDLKLAAQFAGMTVEEFVALNPSHNRPVISATKGNEIKLPADRIDEFIEAVEKHGEANKTFASWQPYTLLPGETLELVAQRGGVTVVELRQANGLHASSRILPGTRIIAPYLKPIEDETRIEAFVAPRVYEQVDRAATYHTVGRKDTLAGIARKYGVSAATLVAWNGLKNGVTRGTTLLVRPATSQTLLTTENGQRQVLATATKGGFRQVKLAAGEELPAEAQPMASTTSNSAAPSAARAGGRSVSASKVSSHSRKHARLHADKRLRRT
jgi:membrane-bound lytic murein transglycosylase D